jgi:amidohydrolase
MDIKEATRARISDMSDRLIALSHRIHANPELGFEERKASRWLCELLSGEGLDVTPGACDLETAFVARGGSGPLHVAICAEYDCLPVIGHACGHNIIAAMAAGAGIAAAGLAGDLGITISVAGTPAEEVGNAGGKILMLERGGFDGVHAAMMVHPAPIDIAEATMLAIATFDVHYTGKAAHASAFPEFGINAADALVVAQTAIGLLRQQIQSSDRIHGIVTRGGDAPNVIPANTAARFMVRARTIAEVRDLREKVMRCFEAGAIATGSKLEVIGGDEPYADVRHDHELATIYRKNAEALGRSFPPIMSGDRGTASTDMGNLSQVIPSIHPMIGIESLPAINHQPEFTACCVKPPADRAVIDGAIAMAWTVIDLARDEKVRGRLLGRESSARGGA